VPEKKDSAQSAGDAHESNSLEVLTGKALAFQVRPRWKTGK
jgi:hypothetical protein